MAKITKFNIKDIKVDTKNIKVDGKQLIRLANNEFIGKYFSIAKINELAGLEGYSICSIDKSSLEGYSVCSIDNVSFCYIDNKGYIVILEPFVDYTVEFIGELMLVMKVDENGKLIGIQNEYDGSLNYDASLSNAEPSKDELDQLIESDIPSKCYTKEESNIFPSLDIFEERFD